MIEMDRAEQVMRDRVVAPPPASLARGESWPVAWHEVEGGPSLPGLGARQRVRTLCMVRC
jgi:hypothetical protein